MRFVLLLLLLVASFHAYPQAGASVAPAPQIAARSWLLYDYNSGQTLASHEPQQRVEQDVAEHVAPQQPRGDHRA